MEVSMEELRKHNKETDAWIALRGKVYNVTPYLGFHPGGVDELMRAAGKDGTSLFDEIHKWVNAESMLEKCFIGKLKTDSPLKGSRSKEAISNGQIPSPFLVPSTPPLNVPRFDWYQSSKTVSVVVYTKWPEVKQDHVIVDRSDRTLTLTVHIRDSVYTAHLELEKDVMEEVEVQLSQDSGKVEVLFQKASPDIQWSTIGKFLDRHNKFTKCANYNPAYRDCTIERVEQVTMDTKLYTISLPPGCRMAVPLGYHVHLQHNISGIDIVRSYTVVLPSLHKDSQDSRVQDGRALYLLVKIYKDGAFTPWLNNLTPGDVVSVSSYVGDFLASRLRTCSHLVMFSAGTGFTPMVRLIYTCLVEEQDSSRQVKLLFFNKTEADIMWRDQLQTLADNSQRFTYVNCLSEADEKWTGLRGRVTKEMVSEFIPTVTQSDKLLLCVCGPTPFTKSVIQFAEELGHKASTHAFLG